MNAATDRPDGLTPAQFEVVKNYAIIRIRATCRCELYGWERLCARCKTVTDIREAFPALWIIATDEAARMGGRP